MAIQSVTVRGQAKRASILDASRTAFLANGFQATSMQDLLRATDMSPGAFYRYFPGKDALIHALASDAIGHLAKSVTESIGSEPKSVANALHRTLFAIDELEREQGGARLALMIWAETQRSPELARSIAEALRPMLQAIEKLAKALLKRGIVVGASIEPTDVAVVLGGILQGYVVQRALFGVDPAIYATGLVAITRQDKV